MLLPPHAQLIAPMEKLAYLDSQSVTLPGPITALEAWRLVMARPLPGLGVAFWLRDAISSWFGVARIGGFSGDAVGTPEVGDNLDFFLIEHIEDQVLSLTARDRHLDVMTCVTVEGTRLAITASVVVHNWFGRVYMLPVAPCASADCLGDAAAATARPSWAGG
ncbi:hypothetical protein GCM10010873_25170 [Cypionkella aquatica]|uniref:DUF2867 domain-containing protein n=1 Tax=Cypionkella aquatica TaxID=1756042 RepID=A0AA37X069_9RHOB|nr:DUF2867 domain-containing protein [Cypionkella aquatica]GLS87543.1 hypothetical protein GCM10010873_25170 [Cypionkella aquatica]